MPHIESFKAIRYRSDLDLSEVTAPPYDVISPSERLALEQSHPHNFVHISLSAQFDDDTDTNNRYTRSAAALRDWLNSGVLVTDDIEAMFLYRADFEVAGGTRATAGVIAALELQELGTGGVYGHERTTPGPKADRLALMRTTEANLEPLWFFSSAPLAGFAELVQDLAATEPFGDVTDAHGVRHRVWQTAAEQAAALAEQVERTPLVVADGHHRYETAVTYRNERRETDGAGPWDSTLVLISDPAQFAPELLPIHRLVTGVSVGELDTTPFSGTLAELEAFVRSAGPGTVGVADASGRWTVSSSGEIDTVWLAETVLEPAGASIAYEHNLTEVQRALETPGMVAFLMPSTPVELVGRKALEGVRMPPKTTLFWPKPRSGFVLRDLR